MSILDVARAIARGTGTHVPTTAEGLVDNGNQDQLRQFQAITEAGQELARADWEILVREHLDSISATVSVLSLPDDYREMVTDTNWDRLVSRKTMGPVSPAYWQSVKSGPIVSVLTPTIRIKMFVNATTGRHEKKIAVDPVQAGQTVSASVTVTGVSATVSAWTPKVLAYEYRSKNWLHNSASATMRAEIVSDADSCVIDEQVLILQAKWRYLRMIGQSYGDERVDASVETSKMLGGDHGLQVIHQGPGDFEFVAITPDVSVGL